MINTILGKKKKMSQVFVNDKKVPVTVITTEDCVVTQIKTKDKDKYWSVQLGFGSKPAKNTTKPLRGHLAPSYRKNTVARFLREVKLDKKTSLKVGDTVSVSDVFSVGDVISVSGISKGKGFAGVVKRWGFAGGPRTHGQGDRLRAPGSIGQGTTPGRVHKGKKMAGRMGTDKVTVKNLKIISIDPDNNEMFVSGSVPGNNGGLLVIKRLSEKILTKNENSVRGSEKDK